MKLLPEVARWQDDEISEIFDQMRWPGEKHDRNIFIMRNKKIPRQIMRIFVAYPAAMYDLIKFYFTEFEYHDTSD